MIKTDREPLSLNALKRRPANPRVITDLCHVTPLSGVPRASSELLDVELSLRAHEPAVVLRRTANKREESSTEDGPEVVLRTAVNKRDDSSTEDGPEVVLRTAVNKRDGSSAEDGPAVVLRRAVNKRDGSSAEGLCAGFT
ncbi:hypothetical protein J6590_042113 [Homalodisca vitripennis]|nr:hypothetical protein J6590_042113 [Homalodisca vitripennis]